jgi:ornithine cyclodeaminase
MSTIVRLDRIKNALKTVDVVQAIEEGFILYSRGRVVVPPVGEMIFENPPGDVHIKYGYIKDDDYYLIKIASGFYDNLKLGLPSSNGLMLFFSRKTGELLGVLLDEGYLTNIRTAAAGAVAAKYFAPQKVRRAGILGAGTQGRMQLEYLRKAREFRDAIVWGLNEEELSSYKIDMEPLGFRIETTLDTEEVAATCNLIVTCTPSTRPLLRTDQIRPGTHITAMGSDTAEKQELEAAVLQKADRIIVDSISQCMSRGESYQALKAGLIGKEKLVELGVAIPDKKYHRASEDEITVVDLTGVAVQDIQIAKAVWWAL